MRILKIIAAGGLIAALSGFGQLTSERLSDAKAVTSVGNAFQTGLDKGYLTEATYELNYDMRLTIADLFIAKAKMAAKGQDPAPDDPRNPNYAPLIRADQAPLLQTANARLVRALADNGGQRAPGPAAETQVAYDCWLQHEVWGGHLGGYNTDRIDGCKARFDAGIAAFETALRPVAAAAPAPAPTPKAEVAMPGPWVVLFDWDRFNVRKDQEIFINQVLDAARQLKPSVITLAGHTDTTGTADYNTQLSENRAKAVAQALKDVGVTSVVTTSWVGEDDLAVQTGQNVREEKNRRTVVVFGK